MTNFYRQTIFQYRQTSARFNKKKPPARLQEEITNGFKEQFMIRGLTRQQTRGINDFKTGVRF